MRKKVAVLGGGSGLSYLLNGLKQYPLDITAIVSVCDNGSSTGILREEFNIPAVGDIRKVLVSLSETEPLVEQLFNYRFKTTSDLNGHAVGNLLLTAVEEMTGSLSEGIEALSKILNLKGKVVPLTEDNVTLMGEMMDGTIIEGEEQLTKDRRTIKRVYYKEKATPTREAIEAIMDADLIILSMGSLFTSIIPNLICDDIVDAMSKSKAKILRADKKTNTSVVELTIHEGRNHQVKNMFKALGYNVIKLKRERISFLTVDGLSSGDYRQLSIHEVKKLYNEALNN